MATSTLLTLPYDMKGLSKNRRYGRRGGGTYLAPAARAMHDRIVEGLEGSGPWVTGPVHITVRVFRPDMRADPINVLDSIADAVKVGIGVDDRWFNASVEWELDKPNPRIEVVVSQDETDPQQVCSRCAEQKSASEFWKGQGRCKPCQREAIAEGPNPTKRGKNKPRTKEALN